VTLLRSGVSEIQYVALRNTLLLMQKYPDLLAKEMKVEVLFDKNSNMSLFMSSFISSKLKLKTKTELGLFL
jgi:hypothetical protein